MKKNPKISVIIPTYNREKLISKSVKSVLNQSYENIELIVVDDESTDNTEKVLKQIKDKRLKYIKLKKNSGACHARNYGIKKATGDYIAFQDSDDIYRKDKLKLQLENLIKNQSDMDFCKISVHEMEKEWSYPTESQEDSIHHGDLLNELCHGNFISTQAILAKKEVFHDISFDEALPRFQDYDLVLQIASNYTVSYFEEPLVDLYIQSDSISKNDEKLKKACIHMLRKNYNFSPQNQETFEHTMLFFLSKEEIDSLNKKYDELVQKYNEMEENFHTERERMQKVEAELVSITSSKRWKYLTKFLKIFHK